VGAERSLKEELQRFDRHYIQDHLRQRNIVWHFKPPIPSHMGGAWERLIRSCLRVLTALLSEQTLSDEGLLTLIVEVEAILNSRPLTPIALDPSSDGPLTPNHLLYFCRRVMHSCLREYFRRKTAMDDVGGLRYNTQQTNSGEDGDASTCLPFYSVRSGLHDKATSKSATWCFWLTTVSQGIVCCLVASMVYSLIDMVLCALSDGKNVDRPTASTNLQVGTGVPWRKEFAVTDCS